MVNKDSQYNTFYNVNPFSKYSFKVGCLFFISKLNSTASSIFCNASYTSFDIMFSCKSSGGKGITFYSQGLKAIMNDVVYLYSSTT